MRFFTLTTTAFYICTCINEFQVAIFSNKSPISNQNVRGRGYRT